MAVLERSELEASPLADLHTIADQLGLDGFRRLRKADLVNAILGDSKGSGGGRADGEKPDDSGEDAAEARPRRRRALRSRRPSSTSAARDEASSSADEGTAKPERSGSPRSDGERSGSPRSDGERSGSPRSDGERSGSPRGEKDAAPSGARRGRGRSTRSAGERGGRASSAREETAERDSAESSSGDGVARIAAGVVELLGNGSAFLRVSPPEASDEDVYISAAQVRRCELVSGDRVTGPVRTPRRSERYPSLVRIDTINGQSADAVSDGSRYEDLPVAWPTERLALGSQDPTLQAIEWLTPLGRGSRALITGARHAGKSETLRRLLDAVHGQDDLEVSLVLSGARPEEISDWHEGPVTPAAALTFAASPDSHDQAVERALDAAKRVASRGGDALVLIDSIDALHPHAARKALAAARNLRDGGSLTVIATAAQPLGGETTVIALDVALTSTGRQPILDLAASGTLKPELLVGADGAEAIAKARASAVETVG